MGQIHADDLKQFVPFHGLDEHQLLLLVHAVEYRKVSPGTILFEWGDIDSNEYLLLSGKLQLESADNARRFIVAGDNTASRPIAKLRPRQYTVTAIEPSEVLVIDADVLEGVQEQVENEAEIQGAYFVDEVTDLEGLESHELHQDFVATLRQNKLVLPSLPEVALKVRKLLESEEANVDEIAMVINSDPAIAAKLIRAANSPLYHGTAKCEATRNAVVRLGLRTTKQLVVSFTLRDLFQTSSMVLKKRMKEAWEHSIEVAAICFVIARMLKSPDFPVEEALLGGLLHDIGVIAILSYIELHPEIAADDDKVESIVQQLRGKAGEEILSRWNFSPAFIKAAVEADNWQRQHTHSADLSDIVQVAKLHSYIYHKHSTFLPKMDQISAFRKLPLGPLSPQLTIQILEEAKDQINDAKQLLSGDSSS